MTIRKIEPKQKTRSMTFNVPNELVENMSLLDKRLENNQSYEGSLGWENDIQEAIRRELKRDITPTRKYKIKLPVDVADQLRSSEVNWDEKVARAIKILISKNKKILDDIDDVSAS